MPSAVWTLPEDFAYNEVLDYAKLNARVNDNLYWLYLRMIPVGSMVVWPGNSYPPTGYLLANGQAVSQATYATLYALITTTFNTGGEGTGNFRLPNPTAIGSNMRWVIRYV